MDGSSHSQGQQALLGGGCERGRCYLQAQNYLLFVSNSYGGTHGGEDKNEDNIHTGLAAQDGLGRPTAARSVLWSRARSATESCRGGLHGAWYGC